MNISRLGVVLNSRCLLSKLEHGLHTTYKGKMTMENGGLTIEMG